MWAAALGVRRCSAGRVGGLASASTPASDSRRALPLVVAIVGCWRSPTCSSTARWSACAVAWSTERPYLRVLREDWFYAERLIEDAAAFLLRPLMVISFRSIDYAGVMLFFAPLYMIYLSSRRYIELRKAQDQMIQRERMAAKGEMAAEIGHELRQQLAAISGRAQMLLQGRRDGVVRRGAALGPDHPRAVEYACSAWPTV